MRRAGGACRGPRCRGDMDRKMPMKARTWRTMAGATACSMRTTPVQFVSSTRSKCSRGCSMSGAVACMPASSRNMLLCTGTTCCQKWQCQGWRLTGW